MSGNSSGGSQDSVQEPSRVVLAESRSSGDPFRCSAVLAVSRTSCDSLRSFGVLGESRSSGDCVQSTGVLAVVLVLPLPSCTVRCRKKHVHDEPPTASVVSGLDAHCAAGPPDFYRPVNSTEMQARKSWLLVLASPAQGGPVDTTTIQRMAGKSSEPEIGDLLKGCGVPGDALVFWGSYQ